MLGNRLYVCWLEAKWKVWSLRVLPLALTYPGDEVVLQVEDPQLPAPAANVLDPLEVLLVKGNFLQREDLALVVLRTTADHLFGD